MQQTAISTSSTKAPFLLDSPGPSLFECLLPAVNVWHKTGAVITGIVLVSLLAQARFFPVSYTHLTLPTILLV